MKHSHRKYEKRVIIILAIAGVLFCIGFVTTLFFSNQLGFGPTFVKVDTCIDSGGCWDAHDETCRSKEFDQALCNRPAMHKKEANPKYVLLGIATWLGLIVFIFIYSSEFGYWVLQKSPSLESKYNWARTLSLAVGLMVCFGCHRDLIRRHGYVKWANLGLALIISVISVQFYIECADNGFEKLGTLFWSRFF